MALHHAAAALLLLLAAHGAAIACSCVDLSRSSAAGLRARFAAAERVVHARVSQALSPHEAQIEVLESFKGSGATLAAMRENDCAFQFSPGEEYVYFVFNGVVSLCGRVTPRAELLERLRALRIPDPVACEGVPRPQRPPGLVPSTEQDVRYEPLHGSDPEAFLGAGHVRPANEADRDDWVRRLVLPVFVAPDGALKLWLVPGSVSPEAQIETGYETTSLIVLQARADGWLLLRYGDPAAKDIGWVHRCHLEAATPRLRYEPWEQLFASEDASPLFFRAWVPHVLREAPSPSSRALVQIPSDPNRYGIQPLEFRGDWARVQLSVPSRYCAERDVKSTVHEGWIRWRSPERGPWVWYYTRGC
jgi:hypothetical protein